MRGPLAIAVGAALAAAAGLAVSTAGAGRTARSAPAKKTAWFQLVFEGTSEAERIFDEAGPTGGCLAQLHLDLNEDATFGRGKGVVMEFVQYGPGKYGFQRLGRTGDSSFNVVGKVTRRAAGSADIVQDSKLPTGSCPPQLLQHYDLSKDADCGKPKTENVAWSLHVEGEGALTHFAPTPTKGASLRGVVSDNRCGAPPAGSALPSSGDEVDMRYGWPITAKFTLEPIPFAKMFNPRYRAFKVDFKTLPKPDSKVPGHEGAGLESNWTDFGTAEATVRFIRCFPKSVAKAGQTQC